MTHDMIGRKGVVDRDGVHLSDNMNRIAAASICTRLYRKERNHQRIYSVRILGSGA